MTAEGRADSGSAAAPEWLAKIAAAAPELIVPPQLRPPANGGRPAAVLILFGEGSGGPDVLIIERAADLRKHPGQPAFPGGAIDESDGGPVRAALREAAEETGLDPAGVRILAVLPELYIPRSDFRVTPVLGWWHTPVAVGPGDPAEIAAVVRIPVADLAAPAEPASYPLPEWRAGLRLPGSRPDGLGIHGAAAGPRARARWLGAALGLSPADNPGRGRTAGGLAAPPHVTPR